MLVLDLIVFTIFMAGIAVGLWIQYFWAQFVRRHM